MRDPKDQIQWLLQQTHQMHATHELSDILAQLSDTVLEITSAERCFIFLKNNTTRQLSQSLARNCRGTNLATSNAAVKALAELVIEQLQTIVASIEQKSVEYPKPIAHILHHANTKFVAAMPMMAEDTVIGALCILANDDINDGWTQTHEALCQQIVKHAGVAVYNARMFERTTSDPLTGLPNDSALMLELNRHLNNENKTINTGLLLIDLDDFKRLNTLKGALGGDEVLVELAQSLQNSLHHDGFFVRYRSDTFALLLHEHSENIRTDLRLLDAAERIRAVIGAKRFHDIRLSACIGAINIPSESNHDAVGVIALADNALKKARLKGPGSIELLNI